jgi:hypothetical protein
LECGSAWGGTAQLSVFVPVSERNDVTATATDVIEFPLYDPGYEDWISLIGAVG